MVTFSPAAYTELHSRIRHSKERHPGVVVAWHEAIMDHVRSPEGRPLWKEAEPAQWYVVVMSLSELNVDASAVVAIGDLKVHFLPGKSQAQRVTVDFVNGRFAVHPNGAA